MIKDGLQNCARHCIMESKKCKESNCRKWIDYPDDYNCCLISIYKHGGPLTLREVGERIGVSFARIKQIETQALKKMKRHSLLKD
tara:strand:+ start:809 stop:1063 length:255 start_codon:yes stop_codon:yes gene_type:complete